jgi:outer membrane immunogenic protein
MTKLFLAAAMLVAFGVAAPATAADLAPIRKAPPLVAAPETWTGFYIGGHVGGGFGNKWWDEGAWIPSDGFELANIGANLGTTSMDGILGGGQIGYNWQFGHFVFGIEGTFSATNMGGRFNCIDPASNTCISNLNWIATAVARIGVPIDRALFYVGAGGAWVQEKDRLICQDAECNSIPVIEYAGTNINSGWTFLTGVEYNVTSNWSVRVQYNYYQFADKTVNLTAQFPNNFNCGGSSGGGLSCDPMDMSIRLRVHSLQAGINYRINWGY